MPLLRKELYEQAQRKRTYWLRVLAAGLMFLALGSELLQMYREYGASHEIFGTGAEMMRVITSIQTACIFLYLPAAIAASIGKDIENRTIQLLLITDIRPLEFVLQKFGSVMIPLVSLLMLTLPFMAITYLIGGVDSGDILPPLFTVAVQSCLLGSLCILMSLTSKTTLGAIIKCYLLGPLALMGVFMLCGIPTIIIYFLLRMTSSILESIASRGEIDLGPWIAWAGPDNRDSIIDVLMTVFMLIAAWRIFRRAAGSLERVLSPAELIHKRTKPKDLRRSHNVNRPLPDVEPLAWRQRHHGITRASVLFKTAGVLLGGTIILMALVAQISEGSDTLAFSDLICHWTIGLWVVTAMIVTVQASASFSAERSQDTLQMLLVTPLTGPELIRQKMLGPRRIVWFASAILIIASVIRFAAYMQTGGDKLAALQGVALPTINLILFAIITLPLIGWASLWLGLNIHSHQRATTTTLSVIAAWLVGAWVLPIIVLELFNVGSGSYLWNLTMLSPITVPMLIEMKGLEQAMPGNPWVLAAISHGFFAAMMMLLRWHVLRRADVYLGRAEADCSSAPATPDGAGLVAT